MRNIDMQGNSREMITTSERRFPVAARSLSRPAVSASGMRE